MAWFTKIWGLSLLLPRVTALQSSSVLNSAKDNASRTFVSANKMWCGQALRPTAEDALSLYKSMPRGKLYEDMSINDVGSCEDRGYILSSGIDPCYTGLLTFYRSEAEKNQFVDHFQLTLKDFGTNFNLNVEDTNLLDACKCKDGSSAKRILGNSCDNATVLQSMVEKNPRHTFVSKNKMFCAQAPKHLAVEALELYKTMPRGKLYDGIIVKAGENCESLGYQWSAGEDPCYPGLMTFYHNEEEENRFVELYEEAVKEFGERSQLSFNDANLMDSCLCKDGSFAKNYRGSSCVRMSVIGIPGERNTSASSTFVSANKKFCAQAAAHVAQAALNLYKTMPRGTLYDGMRVSDHENCGNLGYNLSAGEDPCYPGLQTFYRDEGEERQFIDDYQNAVKEFGDRFNFTMDDSNLMDSCKCKEDSYSRKFRGSSCDLVNALQTSVELQNSLVQTVVSFVSTNKRFCAQAQLSIAKDALNLYKSMPRGKVYEGELENDGANCENLGYILGAGEDPCYPGLLTFYRNEEEERQFIDDYQIAVQEFANRFNFTVDDANLMDSCQCKESSYARKSRGRSCDLVNALQTSVALQTSLGDPGAFFISTNKRFCAQASNPVAKEALKLYKSMPRAKLYDGVSLGQGGNCKDLGYTNGAGEDPCYPGLLTFYRNKEEGKQFFDDYRIAVKKFGDVFNFTEDDANLMDSCQCKEGSYAKKYRGHSCDRVKGLKASMKTQVSRTFLSTNKRFCAQAPVRIVEGALALYKAMPRGKLYDTTLILANAAESCEQLGYTRSAGEDPCYPGLFTYYRNSEEEQQFVGDISNSLMQFGTRYNFSYDDTSLMDSCSCHADSYAAKYRGKSCDKLKQIEASWVHHEPHTGKAIACAGGPFLLATRALAVMKTSQELPMHQSDQIAPVNCDKLGFPFRAGHSDICFTGIHAWTKTKDFKTDTYILETKTTLKDLLNGGFKNFTKLLGLDSSILEANPLCKCAPSSAIGKMKAHDDCHISSARSHIRDWWQE